MRLLWNRLSVAIHLIGLSFLLTACGGGSSSSSETNEPEVIVLSGLWIGITEENTTTSTTPTEFDTYLLFDEDLFYVLREDEALLGTYAIEDNELSTFDMDVYPYANPDTDNEFYVGTDDTNNLTLSALQATSSKYVINYNNATRAGRIDVDLDTAQVSGITVATVVGEWDTTDATMVVNADGGYSGWNSDTSCQWEGNVTELNNTLLRLQIQRENCLEFNVNGANIAEGLAFVDGNGELHFLATNASDLLWMQFTASTTTATPTTDTETETEEAAP